MTSVFSNREIASALWLLVLAGYVLSIRGVRKNLEGLIRTALHWKLLLVMVLLGGYTWLVVVALARLDLWSAELLKDTIFWFLFAGLALAFSAIDSAQEKRGFWRRLILNQIKITILVEWLFNTYTFSLLTEIGLVPLLTFLVVFDAVAGSKPDFRPAAKVTSWVLAFAGFALVAFSLRAAISSFAPDQTRAALRSIALAPLLSIALIPFAFFLALITTYELLLLRLRFATKSHNAKLAGYAARRIIWYCRFRPFKIHQFWRVYLRNFMGAREKADIREVMRMARRGRRYTRPL